MKEEIFWTIVEESKKEAESFHLGYSRIKNDDFYEYQANIAVNILSNYSDEDISDYDKIFWSYWSKAYTPNVLAIMLIVEDEELDDYFRLLRCWIIYEGRFFYEKALDNPDELVDNIDEHDIHFPECFFKIADEAFIKKHYPRKINDDEIPISQKYDFLIRKKNILESNEDFEKELPKLYPKLWAKFK